MKFIKYYFFLLFLIYPFNAFGIENNFPLGIASGDPLTNQVIIWTKVEANLPEVSVKYEVSEDVDFNKIITEGQVQTDPNKDYTVKVDVKALRPNKTYFYRFSYNNQFSEVGRTKTLPSNTNRFKMAFTSCQHFSDGYFSAYDHITKDNPDVIVMLGDFIYEHARSKPEQVRDDQSGYAKDLETYRKKYKVYLTDKSLRAARQNFPFISIWDDHEVMNDYSGINMLKQDPKRLLDAYKAYFEYIPIREIDRYRIYKNFKIGNLIEMFMLDGRQYRDENVCHNPLEINFDCTRNAHNKDRTYLGKEQKEWLLDGLEKSNVTWKLLGNNTAMFEISIWDNLFNFDQWDGFYSEKSELVDLIENKLKNVLLVTGDIHTFFDADIKHNNKIIAKEVTATSLATRGHFLLKLATPFIPLILPHVKYVETSYRGYILTEFDTRKADIYFYGLDSIKNPESKKILLRKIELIRKK